MPSESPPNSPVDNGYRLGVGARILRQLSHDLRSPLNVILGYAQLFQTAAQLSAIDADAAGEIFVAGLTMNRLISEVHDLADLADGTLELHCARQSAGALVTAAVREASRMLEHPLIVHEAIAAAPDVLVDESHLVSGLVAIILAAARSTRPSAALVVGLLAAGTHTVELAICSEANWAVSALLATVEPDATANHRPTVLERAQADLAVASYVFNQMNAMINIDRFDNGALRFRLGLPAFKEAVPVIGRLSTLR